MIQAGRCLPSSGGDIVPGTCSSMVFCMVFCCRWALLCTPAETSHMVGRMDASAESRNLAFASRPQALREAVAPFLGCLDLVTPCLPRSKYPPHHTQELHDVFTSEGTSPSSGPQGNPVGSVSAALVQEQAPVRGQICSLPNSAFAMQGPESFSPNACPMGIPL